MKDRHDDHIKLLNKINLYKSDIFSFAATGRCSKFWQQVTKKSKTRQLCWAPFLVILV